MKWMIINKGMEDNRRIPIYHTLFFRTVFYYAVILAFFALLLGAIFIRLYSNHSEEELIEQLQGKGEKIALRMEQYVLDDNGAEAAFFLGVLDDIEPKETRDIWVVSNPYIPNSMKPEMENTNLDDILLMTDKIEPVLAETFQGKIGYFTGYVEVYGKVMTTVAVPIHRGNKEIVGAVLINSYMEIQNKLVHNVRIYIFVSAIMALVLSVVISFVFANRLSLPIRRMRKTALKLAEGNYKEKTGIKQKDEIGDLANTIDILSERLQQAEEVRKDMEQIRLDFFANVSHELRTPITVVRAYTETLIDGVVKDPDRINQYYGRMLLECKSMERLVGDLLILSKMQNPDFEIDTELVNLIQIFEDILRSIRAISTDKNISFDFKMEQPQYMMYGDYDRLRQMFLIILDNAVKFSENDSNIAIKIYGSDHIIVSIRDEGVGIAKEELPHIFDKFYKSKLRQNAKGSGLGLAIAKQIALKHNGEIKVESELGKGTEFIFVFECTENKM